MNWQILKILSKAPKKKYIKKMLEYAVMVSQCKNSVPLAAVTPIGQQFPQDFQITAEESHKVVGTLVRLVDWSQSIDFNADKIRNTLEPFIEIQLAQILADLLVKMQQDINTHSSMLVSQADKLLNFDWQLDMEVATDKGKTNIPVVQLQLSTSKASEVIHTKISMKGPQFDVFFRNLQKIKDQLGELVSNNAQ